MSRCEELVSTYLSDNDPDAELAVGADMRKIQCCFALLKVTAFALLWRYTEWPKKVSRYRIINKLYYGLPVSQIFCQIEASIKL